MTDRNCLHVVPLPPRKRLLAGFKKNGWSYPPSSSSSSSSSSSPSSFPETLAAGSLQAAEPAEDPTGGTCILPCNGKGDGDGVNNGDGDVDVDGVDNGDGNGHRDRDRVENGNEDGAENGSGNGDGHGDGAVDTIGKIYVTISDDDDDNDHHRAGPSSSLAPLCCSPSNQSSSLTSDRAESDFDPELDARTDGTPSVSEVNEEERALRPALAKRGRGGKLHELSTTGDEEFARQLHRAMNSSPRISRRRTGAFQGSDKTRDSGARNGHPRKSTGLGVHALQRMPP